MTELENMTVGEAMDVLRKRIKDKRLIEDNARIDRQRDEAALAALESLRRIESGDESGVPVERAHENGSPILLGLAAVRQVMRETPGQIWAPGDIHRELERRGWLSGEAKFPRAGTESAVGRLLEKGEITKVARGRYRWRDQQEALTEN